MHQVDIEEAKDHLPDLIDVAVKGEEIVITKDDRHSVKLVPVPQTKSSPQFGSGKGLIAMSDDFDEPLKDFEEYMQFYEIFPVELANDGIELIGITNCSSLDPNKPAVSSKRSTRR